MESSERKTTGVACRHCHTQMNTVVVKKYSGKWPYVLVVGGLFCCLFFIGALVGLPMLLLGIYMATAKETIALCPECGHFYKVWAADDDLS